VIELMGILLMFGTAAGGMAVLVKIARYRSLSPDERKRRKVEKLNRRLRSAQREISRSGTDAGHCLLWTAYAKVIEGQIENLQTVDKLKGLESQLESLTSATEINPDASPLELELGIGPDAGSQLAQDTIDRIEIELGKFGAEQVLASKRKRAADGLCCRFCFGEDHQADDCIENPATIDQSLTLQKHLWSERDHRARLAREAEQDSVQTWVWGQPNPVGWSNVGVSPVRMSAGRPETDKAARALALRDMFTNGTITAEFFHHELLKVLNDD
jgi:hypothetical protein